MNPRRLAVPVIALALAVTLTACTDGGIATTTPSPTLASPTATASPTPSASLGPLTDAELLALMPPEAAVDDVRGAIATAKFFLEQYPVVYETGDLSRLGRALDAGLRVLRVGSLGTRRSL